MYLGSLQNTIENGVDWPWLSRSFGVKKVEIGPKQACPHDNLLHFWAMINKFAPNVYLGSLQNTIENDVDWPWPSRSFKVKTVLITINWNGLVSAITGLFTPRGCSVPNAALVYKSATLPGSTFEFYLPTQCSPLPFPSQRRRKRTRKVPIQIRYANLPIWAACYFLLTIFNIKVLLFQVAHLIFNFQ